MDGLPGDGLAAVTGFKYLASPYTHPDQLIQEQRYLLTAEALKILLANRIWTYSPIVHCHQLSRIWGLPGDAAFWQEYDTAMITASAGIFVLMLPGWAESVGVRGEVKLAIDLGKTITYLTPGAILHAVSTCTIHPNSSQSATTGVR